MYSPLLQRPLSKEKKLNLRETFRSLLKQHYSMIDIFHAWCMLDDDIKKRGFDEVVTHNKGEPK